MPSFNTNDSPAGQDNYPLVAADSETPRHDASVIGYQPADALSWNGDADPGDVDDSLDQLALRVDANETTLTSLTNDHGQLQGLGDDDHIQYHNDTRGDARYYTQAALDGGQLDDRYFSQTQHVDTSAGAADAGKPIKLDAGGHVDASMVNDADIAIDNTTGTLPISRGGSGATTQQAALDALMPGSPSAGDIVVYDGSNWVKRSARFGGLMAVADPQDTDEFVAIVVENDIKIVEVKSYIVSGTGTVSFNLIARVKPGDSGGTNITSGAIQATTSGTTTTSFNNADIDAGDLLVFDQTAKTLTPTLLRVFIKYRYR